MKIFYRVLIYIWYRKRSSQLEKGILLGFLSKLFTIFRYGGTLLIAGLGGYGTPSRIAKSTKELVRSSLLVSWAVKSGTTGPSLSDVIATGGVNFN